MLPSRRAAEPRTGKPLRRKAAPPSGRSSNRRSSRSWRPLVVTEEHPLGASLAHRFASVGRREAIASIFQYNREGRFVTGKRRRNDIKNVSSLKINRFQTRKKQRKSPQLFVISRLILPKTSEVYHYERENNGKLRQQNKQIEQEEVKETHEKAFKKRNSMKHERTSCARNESPRCTSPQVNTRKKTATSCRKRKSFLPLQANEPPASQKTHRSFLFTLKF